MYKKEKQVETYDPGVKPVYTASEIGVARATKMDGSVQDAVFLRAHNYTTGETADIMLDADDIRLLYQTHLRLEVGEIDVDEELGVHDGDS